ncbi:MAG: helix-turn-helix transcriptional regulator [Clostridium lundense]|nr:helix-turn-helix transcriptional regulator [Clostridium lundense]
MSDFSRIIGKNIRTYRRASRMTLDTLAAKIHKSKATVGKYEQGSIAVDADTLYDLAQAFGISPAQLLSEAAADAPAAEPVTSGTRSFLYLYDGRTSRIVKGLLVGAEASEAVTLFYDLASFDEPQRCRALYCGHRQTHDFVTNYLLDNRLSDIEHVFLCVMRSLDRPTCSTGLLSGISSRMFLPACTKCILSAEVLPESEELRASLLLNKDDIKFIRRYNMFMVEQAAVWS